MEQGKQELQELASQIRKLYFRILLSWTIRRWFGLFRDDVSWFGQDVRLVEHCRQAKHERSIAVRLLRRTLSPVRGAFRLPNFRKAEWHNCEKLNWAGNPRSLPCLTSVIVQLYHLVVSACSKSTLCWSRSLMLSTTSSSSLKRHLASSRTAFDRLRVPRCASKKKHSNRVSPKCIFGTRWNIFFNQNWLF